jgi:L-lactate dehydrogenase complex protein LldG
MREKFTIAAEAVGAVIKRFSTVAETTLYLQQLADGGKICTSALPAELDGQLPGLVLSDHSAAADATLCISFADAGIAATGSLLLQLHDPGDRAATALATKHAVFLHSRTIVPTLRDLSASLKAQLCGAGPAYLSVTTGPSRTADIERVLTIGVHGPKELHILLLEGE